MLHIEGMGVLGCGIAWALASSGRPFTWHDIDTGNHPNQITTNDARAAWPASTGAIYPSGNLRDRDCYLTWQRWAENPGTAPWATMDLARALTEAAAYWYVTKNAPHGGSDAHPADLGHMRRHSMPSYHFNAQAFVKLTRHWFRERRVSGAPGMPPARVIVAHGFSPRMKRTVWGWMRPVKLAIDPRIAAESVRVDVMGQRGAGLRPCFYFRPNRFTLAYAYPVPGTDLHYAGSSLIVQKLRGLMPENRAALDAMPKYERWKREMTQHSGGWVRVVDESQPIMQGWRPSLGTTADEAEEPLCSAINGQLVVMPLWHSGVRWLPAVIEAVMARVPDLERA